MAFLFNPCQPCCSVPLCEPDGDYCYFVTINASSCCIFSENLRIVPTSGSFLSFESLTYTDCLAELTYEGCGAQDFSCDYRNLGGNVSYSGFPNAANCRNFIPSPEVECLNDISLCIRGCHESFIRTPPASFKCCIRDVLYDSWDGIVQEKNCISLSEADNSYQGIFSFSETTYGTGVLNGDLELTFRPKYWQEQFRPGGTHDFLKNSHIDLLELDGNVQGLSELVVLPRKVGIISYRYFDTGGFGSYNWISNGVRFSCTERYSNYYGRWFANSGAIDEDSKPNLFFEVRQEDYVPCDCNHEVPNLLIGTIDAPFYPAIDGDTFELVYSNDIYEGSYSFNYYNPFICSGDINLVIKMNPHHKLGDNSFLDCHNPRRKLYLYHQGVPNSVLAYASQLNVGTTCEPFSETYSSMTPWISGLAGCEPFQLGAFVGGIAITLTE